MEDNLAREMQLVGTFLGLAGGLWALATLAPLLREVGKHVAGGGRPESIQRSSASLSRALSFVSFSFFLASAPTALASRNGSPIRGRAAHMSESSRSPAGGPPPPQPPARDRGIPGAGGSEAVESTGPEPLEDRAPVERRSSSVVHPAIHRGGEIRMRIEGPLFNRSGRRIGDERTISIERSRGRERSMHVHPAGRGRKPRNGDEPPVSEERGSPRGHAHTERVSGVPASKEHVVRAGDSLWSIAETVLATKDLRRIARYWPLIHKTNATLIGRDPSLIIPGQRLSLPPEKDV